MELLKQLYKIHSMSGREKKMKRYVRKWIAANVPDAKMSNDKLGNIYVVRGESETYPVVVAHLDQVQNDHSRDFQALQAGEIIIGYSPKSRAQQGLGADDKNGVWIALQCLLKYDCIKIALFVSEEIGCVGSSGANMSFFEDARFVLQCDRRGAHDLITTAGWTDLCSPDFVKAIQPELFGYKEAEGMLTDVLTLKENGLAVSCINMSCGYYEPHTDVEFTNVPDLLNCLAFVEHIIETCTDVYPHEYAYSSAYYDRYEDMYGEYYNNTVKSNDKRYNTDELISSQGDFYEMYYDVVKEVLETYPNASFDEVYWYLKESFPTTYFWEDWTKALYVDVKCALLEEQECERVEPVATDL